MPNDEEIEKIEFPEDTFWEIEEEIVSTKRFSIIINRDIIANKNVSRLLSTLRNADEDDLVEIYLNCAGGEFWTTMQIIHAINDCKCPVVTIADGQVCSAATMVFLAGDILEVKENVNFLIHNISIWYEGKGGETKNKFEFKSEYHERTLRKIYQNFLTDVEINEVLADKDIWLSEAELRIRIESMGKNRKENEK